MSQQGRAAQDETALDRYLETARGLRILTLFFLLTVPLMPVQAVLVRTWTAGARRFPHWYHRQVVRLFGIRIKIQGRVVRDRPVLLVSNHTSWLDIPVLSAVAPVSFVAKREVSRWPFVSSLARLQRTVFVDREKRTAVAETTNEMIDRLKLGDAIVLFAEGTSSDGNRVLPFKTSLFAAAKPPGRLGQAAPKEATVQTVSLVYTGLHGVRFGRGQRSLTGWYGDMEMQSHAWSLLKAGPLDIEVRVGDPVPLESFEDRKDLARKTEDAVRQGVIALLRGLPEGERVEAVTPTEQQRREQGAKRSSGELFK